MKNHFRRGTGDEKCILSGRKNYKSLYMHFMYTFIINIMHVVSMCVRIVYMLYGKAKTQIMHNV